MINDTWGRKCSVFLSANPVDIKIDINIDIKLIDTSYRGKWIGSRSLEFSGELTNEGQDSEKCRFAIGNLIIARILRLVCEFLEC